MMTGVRREKTDNNSLILCPSGERRKNGIRKDAVHFPFLPIPFYATRTLVQSKLGSVSLHVCMSDFMGFLGCIQNVCTHFYHIHGMWFCIAFI